MFGIGFGEFVVIGLLLLIAVGPRRMPLMMKSVGRAMREFRKATRELRAQTGIDELLADDDVMRPMKKKPAQVRPDVVAPRAHTAIDAIPDDAAKLSDDEARTREYPPEGVDLVEARERVASTSDVPRAKAGG